MSTVTNTGLYLCVPPHSRFQCAGAWRVPEISCIHYCWCHPLGHSSQSTLRTEYGRCISCTIHSQNILAHYRRRSPHLCSLSDLVSTTFPSSLVLPSDFSSLPSPAYTAPPMSG
ncbi:hypothetical protein A0H81_12777 [Grifola frondosa]|uniref:Uncharacterized protein n=1 Tax=Grifola frondosa TaxID=5627 RepID=A0A1C7LR02_GRIFR|nr:hypothetical protein A0H81_12777 [Grifola frondosa]